jgi:hypothetical protein
MSHQNNGARPILLHVPRDEELHNRLRDNRHGNFHAQGIAYQPIHLTGVLDIKGGRFEVWIRLVLRRLRIFGQQDKLKADRSKGA